MSTATADRSAFELNITIPAPHGDGIRGGVVATGGFDLCDPSAQQEECWCDDFYWFQAIRQDFPPAALFDHMLTQCLVLILVGGAA